jgi:hypothetical protein
MLHAGKEDFSFQLDRASKKLARPNLQHIGQGIVKVPSRLVLELADASSGDMRLSDHAARSMI